jgi:O-antigen chain-terminating methyltransferase
VLPVLLDALERDPEDRAAEPGPAHRLDEVVQAVGGRRPVLDLGCGRGELMVRLAELGVEASGVEPEPALAAEAARRGLAVEVADPLAALETRAGAGLGAITAVHLLERLGPEAVVRLIGLAREALAEDGVLVARVLDPASPEAAARLWRDPRNQRPLPPETLAGLLEACGLEVLQGPPPRDASRHQAAVVVSARRPART